MINKIFILLLITSFSCYNISGQGHNREKLKALKTAFITEKLDLSSKEAENFWPIYNQHQEKLYNLKYKRYRDERKKIRELGGAEAISEKEADKYIRNFHQIEANILEENKLYYKQLRKAISSKKILKLYSVEREFNRKLLNEYRHKRSKN